VVRYFWFLPTSTARSLVIEPFSTTFIQTFSKVFANFFKSSLPSSFPLCYRPLAHAKIEAMGFVEVSLPC